MPAWTQPRTWLPLEEQTSAVWNQHVRDKLLAQRWGTWQGLVTAGFTIAGGVTDYGGTYAPGRVRVSGDGRNVEMRGLFSTTGLAAGATIMTAPVGMRPAVIEIRQTMAADLFWRINLNTDGTITAGTALGATWFTMAGITWATD